MNKEIIMKNFKILPLFLLVFSVIGLTSCETETIDSDVVEALTGNPPVGGGGAGGAAVFKVDFGGDTYVATMTSASVTDGNLTIGGLRGTNGEAVAIIIPDVDGTGTYNDDVIMTYVPGMSEFFYTNMDPDDLTRSGSVTITNINTTARTVSGTFNFTGYYTNPEQNLPNVPFTNGTFQNIPYEGNFPGTNPGPEPDPNGKFFRATVDGNLINFANVTVFALLDTYRIAGTNVNNSMSISVPNTITAGTYPIGEDLDGVTAGYIPGMGTDAYYSLPGGSLTIQSVGNGWIKGTFSYTAENFDGETVVVTQGSFNAQLP